VTLAFLPRLLDVLVDLPVVESWPEARGDWLHVFGLVTLAQTVVAQPDTFRKQPSLSATNTKKSSKTMSAKVRQRDL
jgi:hypothetical protein